MFRFSPTEHWGVGIIVTYPTNEAGMVKRVVSRVLRTYADHSPYVLNVHGGPMQRVGVPDLLVVIDGLAVFLEVKFQRPGESAQHARGRASAVQLAQIDRLREAGATAAVILDEEEALAVIDGALKKLSDPVALSGD